MFENEPDKRKQIISTLKEFTDTGDMSKLTGNLNELLKTSQQRVILGQIKPFIPQRQQAMFDNLTSRTSSSVVIIPRVEIEPEPLVKPPSESEQQKSDDSESIPSGIRY
jgi:hypothetical protein